MKLFTAHWEENGKAGRRSFARKADAVGFAKEKVQAADCSSVSIWSYSTTASAAGCLIVAHDRGDWWEDRKYEGTVLKSGAWTTR